MKQLSGILLVVILSFNYFSCFSRNFIIDETNSIDKLSCEEINGPLDTLSRFYHIDLYVITIDSCLDTTNFFNKYKPMLNDKLVFVFPLKIGYPFSINNSRLSDFDYSMLMNIQHRLFPCISNFKIEDEYPSSIRLRSFACIACDYLYEVRNNTGMHLARSEEAKHLYMMFAIKKYDSIVPKMEMKKYNQSNWQEDENKRRERRKEKNIKELGDLFKAISLIVGIAIAIYHRRRKKRF